ncbi:MAG: hypothetical protein KJO65_09090, partial [Gemmatimonadetes bacterium]|nr:hypothetical protein [Gemmatimonadota bacterium]
KVDRGVSRSTLRREARDLERRRDGLTASIEAAEAAIASIDASFAEEGYYERTDPDEIVALQKARADHQAEIDSAMEEWSGVERRIEELEQILAETVDR